MEKSCRSIAEITNTKKKLSSNLFVDMIKFIAAWAFADISKGALPKRRMSQV